MLISKVEKLSLLRRGSCGCSFRGPYSDGNGPPKTVIGLTHKSTNTAHATHAAITLVDLTTTCTKTIHLLSLMLNLFYSRSTAKTQLNNLFQIVSVSYKRPGAHFSKLPKTFRARKAIRKTPTRLFFKAGLFML